MKKIVTLLTLLCLCIVASVAQDNDGFITVNSIEELQKYLKKDGVKVRLAPKEYNLNKASYGKISSYDSYRNGVLQEKKYEVVGLLHFLGSGNTFDFTGATINVDTKLYSQYSSRDVIDALITGNDNTINGLKIVNYGNETPRKGALTMYIMGDRNTVTNADLYAEGSSPYGYGHLLGKGGPRLVPLKKHCGILITGVDTKLLDSYLKIHAYGHAIFMQGAVNTWIEGCTVEGKMRLTDEMLAEKSGPAFDAKFKSTYHPGVIVKGEMKALSEDAYRIYASGSNGRKTVGVNIINCTAIRLRTGFDVSLGSADGDLNIINCEARECQFGYSLNSGAVVENCRGDIKYGPVLTFPYPRARDTKVDITITESQSKYHYPRAAEINGSNLDITLKLEDGVKAPKLPIVFGESFRCDVAVFRDPKTDLRKVSGAKSVRLVNATGMEVILNERTFDCTIIE